MRGLPTRNSCRPSAAHQPRLSSVETGCYSNNRHADDVRKPDGTSQSAPSLTRCRMEPGNCQRHRSALIIQRIQTAACLLHMSSASQTSAVTARTQHVSARRAGQPRTMCSHSSLQTRPFLLTSSAAFLDAVSELCADSADTCACPGPIETSPSPGSARMISPRL